MSDFVDIERRLGEEWQLEQVCLDASGTPLRIIDLRFRMVSRGPGAAVVLDLRVGSGVGLVTDGSDGLAIVTITPAMQSAIPTPDLYRFETQAIMADGTPVDMTYGGFNCLHSLYTEFP